MASDKQHIFVNLHPGDPAPWFRQRASSNPNFIFDSAAGRYLILCFFLTGRDARSREALEAAARHRAMFDDEKMSFFGVSIDAADEKSLKPSLPGIRFFWDTDGTVSRLYGAIPNDAQIGQSQIPTRRFWLVVDPTLRIMARFELEEVQNVFDFLTALPPPGSFAGMQLQAPILYLNNVFEPELCRALIAHYEEHGGKETGFMQEVNGRTVEHFDPAHKRRSDCTLADDKLRDAVQKRINWRIVPEIKKVHQFNVTRMERYLIACYSEEARGHFRAHRDNTTKGTAHRRFAVSINLNDDFDGGELSFPEYSPKGFKMPAGGAGVFSCSLLHQVSPVTRGKRYAFLPFLYDDAAAKIRAENNKFLGEEMAAYREEDGRIESAKT